MSNKKQSIPIGEMATSFAGLAKGGKVTLKAGDGIPSPTGGDSPKGEGGAPAFPTHDEFTLTTYSSRFSMGEEYLVFGISELEPEQEAKAAELGGKSPAAVVREMAKMSIVRIGDKARPDYSFIERWMREIGPRGRRQVDLGFQTVNFMSDDEGEAFLATRRPVQG